MKVRAVLLVPVLLLGIAGQVRAQNPADSAPPHVAPPPARADTAARPPAPQAGATQGPVQIEDVGAPAAPATDTAAAPAAPAPAESALPGPGGASPAPGTPTAAAPAGPARPLRDTTFVLDRVLAVVGNRPILTSQVDEEIFSRQSQGLKPPSSPEELDALRKQVVQGIIDDELLVQEAERDTTIKVTDQEVAEGVEEQVKKIRGNFGSEVEYAGELRKAGFQTPDEYRRWLTDQQRRAALQNRLIEERRGSGKLKAVIPTDKEMREFFAQQKTTLEKRPATLSFRQIVVAPQPSAEERQRAYQLADSIAIALRRGGDFVVAAKRFSMDSASRELGGSLNWFRRGTMVPEFERVAFGLKPGVISDPVETPFGFHVIQVERSQPGEVQARHILIMPDITEQEADSAHRLAESVYQAAKAGASFDSLQRLYHDKPEEREGRDVQVTKLPPAYAKAIGDAQAGTMVAPFPLEGTGTRVKYAVVRVTDRRPEGDVRYEDVRDKIRQQLGDQLAVRRYLDVLRKKAYIDVRS
ncbi:MAG TPA: peptidylprolyl isomerase [Gemmatimonadales bacterium]|nr:peptidylprolyl isomerase [Gemmatimonadales bacterium]